VTAAPPRIATYREFWPFYLREHAQRSTRAIHIGGTGLATMVFLSAFILGPLWLIPVALVAGYAPAWFAHFAIEKNRPATFRYPLWSLASDYRMAWAWLTGSLGEELQKAGICRR
jgi:hypothetical protein